MQIDVEKLKTVLAELGVEEEKIAAAVEVLMETDDEIEGKGKEPSTSEETPTEEVPVENPEEVKEGEGEGKAPTEEVPPASESVPPATEELPPVPPVDEPPLPPTEEVPPAIEPELPPMVSLEEFEQVKNQLEETRKANEGLQARLSSLEEALKSAGIIEGSIESSVGFDDPSAPGRNVSDTTLDDVIAEINRKGY